MPFVDTPTELIASWDVKSGSVTLTGDHVTFPVASVPELTAVEANATTGDLRKIIYALCEQFYQYYYALEAADKPTMMTITKTSSFAGGSAYRNVYTLTFTTSATGLDVADETA